MKILTLTCWLHSISYHLFSRDAGTLLAAGTMERVALGSSRLRQRVPGKEPLSLDRETGNHEGAVDCILGALTDPKSGAIAEAGEISAVGHRVVHGGEAFRHSVAIDADVLHAIGELQHLAPLHCAPNVAGIEAAISRLPGIPHVAIFDTAFHRSMPEVAYLYPLPYEWYQKHGVRRYGFHGPSHLYLSRRGAALLGKPAPECNLITVHLDRGVSLCAIKDGLSIDTSMGMTPLEGAVMETRCGDIDPGIHAYMMQALDLSVQELEQILNHKSGLSGLTGRRGGRQDFLEAVLNGDPRSERALEIEAYRIRKYIGAYLAVIGPLDGLVFTGGAAPNEWLVRERVLAGLEGLGIRVDLGQNRAFVSGLAEVEITAQGSAVRAFVIQTNEELVYVEDVAAICGGVYRDHQSQDYSFSRAGFVPARSAC